jgi:1-acyl-sn-glycerol-3-phosphate acyltransferase
MIGRACARATRLLRVVLGLVAATLFVLAFGPPRRIAQTVGSRLGRGAPVVFHRLLCFILRVRIRQIGRPSPAAARLIVANHVSWLDIPVMGALEPMTFLAKKEVGARFLGRQLAMLQGVVFVDRERKRCIPKVNAEMARAMARGEPVALYAEATTSDGNRLLRFRSSHFEAVRAAGAGAVVQPVYLSYRRVAGLPVQRADRPLFAWYGDTTFFPHMWGVIFGRELTCDIYYGEPLPVEPAIRRKTLARAAETAVRALADRARAGSALPASPKTR